MMNSDFQVASEQIQRQGKDLVAVLRLRGWLDAQSEEHLVTATQESLAAGAHCIILDMTELNVIASAGVRAIQKLYKMLAASYPNDDIAHIKLCNAQKTVYEVLNITGFLHTMPMYESLQAAIESYEE
jgi:anti-anti-sigma factor